MSEEPKRNIGGTIVLAIWIISLIGMLVMCSTDLGSSSSSSSSTRTYTCGVCDRSFQAGSENAKSISRRRMCTTCYSNYKYASDALKELPID